VLQVPKKTKTTIKQNAIDVIHGIRGKSQPIQI